MKFRKKPVVIEAMQFVYDNGFQIIQWATKNNVTIVWQRGSGDTLSIPTLEGDHQAKLGDWIIKGVRGEFYPCKPDIFEATYEPVQSVGDGE